MRSSLALTLVLMSLFVLTTAKPEWVSKYKHHHHHHSYHHQHHHHHHSHHRHHPDHHTGRQRTTHLHPCPTPHPGTPTNIGTPSNSVTHTSSTTHVSAVPTTHSNGWVQNPKGNASFTAYFDCQAASCGQRVNGYSAAVNELAFGANKAAGGACGRCFRITPNYDPYTPSYAGPFGNSIVVKVNDLCPASNNNQWCGQRVSKPLNSYGVPMHFDLCTDSGAPAAFFPGERRAMLGTFEEVSCREWPGIDGEKLWDGSCLAGESAGFWPDQGCPNKGTPP